MHDIYATAYHPPDLDELRRYNVNRGLGELGNGQYLMEQDRQRALARKRRAAIAALTPEQRAAKKAADAKLQAALNRYRALAAKVKQPYSAGPLTPDEELLRQAVMKRDWDAVFTLLPPRWWGPQGARTEAGSPAKYSWREVTRTIYPPGYLARASAARRSRRRVMINGGFEPMTARQLKNLPKKKVRVFKAWQKQDLINWTMSKWYTVQPGWTCTEAQRMAGVAYYWKGTQSWRRNPDTKPNHVYPFWPGGGAKKQRYGCVKPKKSLWDKIKKPLAIAVGVVAAVWLGPIVIGKIVGAGAAEAAGGAAAAGASSGGAAAAGIVGAGAKAGAAVAITTKGAVAAAITTKATVAGTAAMLATVKTVSAATLITGAAEAGTLFSKAQTLTTWINRGRSIDAIIKGELPPPPIGISGGNFTEWAMDLAKKEVQDRIKEEAAEYLSERARKKYEEEQMAIARLEIEKMQAELAALISAQTPIAPAPEIDQPIREKIIEMQNIEKQRAQQNMMLLAGGAAVALFALG